MEGKKNKKHMEPVETTLVNSAGSDAKSDAQVAQEATQSTQEMLRQHFSNSCTVGGMTWVDTNRITPFDPYRKVTQEGMYIFLF